MLLGVRDIAVWPFGLKRTIDLKVAKDDRLSTFRVFERHKDEIILGEDDTHLDFRVSVLVQPASEDRPQRLIVTTLVFYNRLLGRAYLGLIVPFHRLVVRASLDGHRSSDGPAGSGDSDQRAFQRAVDGQTLKVAGS
jgi:hypothetical protein